MQIYVTGVKEVEKVDDHTVDFILSGPVPILLRNIVDFRIMSKSWAEKNRSQNVQDYAKKEETFASRNTNGTGPYMIKGWEPDKQIVFVANKGWWGKLDGNVDRRGLQPDQVGRHARLRAALRRRRPGHRPADAGRRAPAQGSRSSRCSTATRCAPSSSAWTSTTSELKYSNVKGKNPFKDMRVRRALNMAVDREAIKRVMMRGLSIPAGIMVAPGVHGHSKDIDVVMKPDPARREEAARRGGLSERLRVHARLPEQPLRQRREDLPGAGRHVGQGRLQARS